MNRNTILVILLLGILAVVVGFVRLGVVPAWNKQIAALSSPTPTADAAPSASAVPTPSPSSDMLATQALLHLTLKQRIAQSLIVPFDLKSHLPKASDPHFSWFQQSGAGFVLFLHLPKTASTAAELATVLENLQNQNGEQVMSPLPLQYTKADGIQPLSGGAVSSQQLQRFTLIDFLQATATNSAQSSSSSGTLTTSASAQLAATLYSWLSKPNTLVVLDPKVPLSVIGAALDQLVILSQSNSVFQTQVQKNAELVSQTKFTQ